MKKHSRSLSLFVIFYALTLLHPLFAAKIYVDVDAGGANDGTSWTDAYNTIYDAIAAAGPGDEIWVAEGVYYTPPSGAIMEISASLFIYGGFDGTETMRSERNWASNETVISANIGNPLLISDNAAGIFKVRNTTGITSIEIDGFTLSDAYSNQLTFVIKDDPFTQANPDLNLTIGHCHFTQNYQGCVNIEDGTLVIENCLFSANDPTNDFNEIISIGCCGNQPSAEIINTTFYDNSGDQIVFALRGTTAIYNSIFWNNAPEFDELLVSEEATAIVRNTIMTMIFDPENYALETGVLDTIDIFLYDPQFSDPSNGDFTLDVCSPAIDAGDAVYLNQIADLNGNDRTNGQVDLGCFEYQSVANVIYVDRTASGANDGTSWTDAYIFLQDAVANAQPCTELWVAEGFYVLPASIILDQDMKIFGGFDGSETSKSDRDWSQNLTRISADVGNFGDPSDNLDNLFDIQEGLSPVQVVLNGLVLEDVNNGSAVKTTGLSLDSEVKIRYCTFRDNSGVQGAALHLPGGTVDVITSLFYDNFSTNLGTCVFSGDGTVDADVSIYHCTFGQNSSSYNFGSSVLYAFRDDLSVYNSIVFHNATEFAVSTSLFSEVALYNSILSSVNGTAIIQQNTIFDAPQFTDTLAFDFTVAACSPAVDAADPDYKKGQYDIAKDDRESGAAADIGCYERQISGSVIYVDSSATGGNDGTSWFNAFTDLQDALAVAGEGDEIWVARGTYFPTDIADPDISFEVYCGVSLYGGFAGFEFERSDRDIDANPTILSGKITGSQNTHQILYITNYKAYAQIDGFTIKLGDAAGHNPPWGAAMYLEDFDGIIDNCTFLENTAVNGGAIAINGASEGEIRNCSFLSNFTTGGNGGAVYLFDSDLTFRNTIFRGNTASDGGAVYVSRSNPNFVNCLYDDNEAGQEGGAIFAKDTSQLQLDWNTFYGNFAPTGGGAIEVDATSTASTINSIYWENRQLPFDVSHFGGTPANYTPEYCIIQDGWAGGNAIITDDPLLKDPGIGNFVPASCSPAIDAAKISGLLPPNDIRKASRSIGNGPDIGAYELIYPYYFDGKAGPDTVVCQGDEIILQFPFQQRDTTLTDLTGSDLRSGIFFDIVPKENMTLKRFHGHWIEGNGALLTRAWVYWRRGSWIDAQLDQSQWEYASAVSGITINSTLGDPTYIPVDYLDLELEAGKTYGFYIYLDEEGAVPAEYVRTQTPPASGFGDLQADLDHLSVYYGRSTATAPWGALSPFAAAFEGGITYVLYDSLQWSDGSTVIGTDQTVSITPDTTSEVLLTMFDVNGCSYTDTIILEATPPPENNTCGAAQALVVGGGFVDGSTRCASATAQSVGSCNTNPSPTVWYTVQAPPSGKMRIRAGDIVPYTMNLNLKLVVYTGSCGALTEVACIDNAGVNENENMTLSGTISGETYYIAVRGANNQEGDFRIQVDDPCLEEFFEEPGLPGDTTLCFNTSYTLEAGVKLSDTLETQIVPGDSVHGLFFDIVAKRAIRLSRLTSKFTAGTNLAKDVYYRFGSHVGYKYDMGAWVYLGSVPVSPGGANGQVVEIPVDFDVVLEEGDTLALYFYDVLGIESIIADQAGGSNGDVAFEDDRVQILKGRAMDSPAFGGTLVPGPHVLQGQITYDIIDQVVWYRNGIPFTLGESIEIQAEQDGAWSYTMGYVNGCESQDTIELTLQDNVVRNTLNTGLHSLRNVAGCLTGNDTLKFDPLIDGDTIQLSGSQIILNVNNSLIQGRGPLNTIISGNNFGRIFLNNAGSAVTIRNLSLMHGSTFVTGGGAIRNEGDLILQNASLHDNMSGADAGALFNSGLAILQNVIFSQNMAVGTGEHILNQGVLELRQGVQVLE